MMNLKKILHSALLSVGLFASVATSTAQNIPGTFFGQNAWMPDTIGNASACAEPPCVLNGKLHKQWSNIAESRAGIIRFGGIAADRNMPTNHQYIKMIDSIRAKGMEPIIQVPYHKGRYTAQQAAAIVQYVNGTKARKVKYWIIGNEPDLEYGFTNASQVANYIRPFSSAMKSVDPTILIVGPECAWFNRNILDGLTQPNGPDDITGKDANGRYYVDVISYHTYPFNGSQSRSQMLTKLTESGEFQDNLTYLNGRLAGANNTHNRGGNAALQIAITEANVNFKNPGNDGLQGTGANSFIGGQFVVEMMGIGMKQNVKFMNIWSVVEGNSTELNIGYLDASTGNRKPAYYMYKMMAEHFRGNVINATSSQPNVKVFASQSGKFTTVMILNQDQSSSFATTVKLNTGAASGNNALKINVGANIQAEVNETVKGQSTMLLMFNEQGQLVKRVEYTMNDHAANNRPPSVQEFGSNAGTSGGSSAGNGTGVATSVDGNGNDIISMKGFGMKVYPNPANSKFTIEIDRPNQLDVKFQVEIYDVMGRLIYSKSSVFADRQQQVDMSGQSLAEAVYIVKVREQDDKDNWKSSKVIVFK